MGLFLTLGGFVTNLGCFSLIWGSFYVKLAFWESARPGRISGPVRRNFETEWARPGAKWRRFQTLLKATFNSDEEETQPPEEPVVESKAEPESIFESKVEMKRDMVEELSLGDAVKKLNDSNESIKMESNCEENSEPLVSDSELTG